MKYRAQQSSNAIISHILSSSKENIQFSNEENEDEIYFFTDEEESETININSNMESEESNSEKLNIRKMLAGWATKHLISSAALNELLAILKNRIPELPLDSRTLKNTPRENLSTVMDEGFYVNYGLKDTLTDFLLKTQYESDVLELDVNIDGLPLSKSSKLQIWPILINVVQTNYVMMVGAYEGNSKPSDRNAFLREFVHEMKELLSEGFTFQNRYFTIKLRTFICDAPARSFLLNIKSHTGYFSCIKCEQKGERINNKIIYPYEKCNLRTDASFRNRTQIEHHHQSEPLLLECLNIDFVKQFILDYMHIVCLGVMKTLLKTWIKQRDKAHSLKKQDIESMSFNLISMKKCIPYEFIRKPRSFDELDRWKATELRQFLLYTGPLVLKNKLPPRFYEHFLKLSLAIRILLHETDAINNNKCAEKLLNAFVKQTEILYGKDFLTYNFHCLTHLHSDSLNFGSLENINAFKFENYLQILKKQVKLKRNVTTQLYNRAVERSQNSSFTQYVQTTNIDNIFGKKLSDGSFKSVKTKNFKISIEKPDNIFLFGDKVFKIVSICQIQNNVLLKAQEVIKLQSFFSQPISSDLFKIYFSDKFEISNTTHTFNLNEISAKIVHIDSIQNIEYFTPIIHTFDHRSIFNSDE